MYRIQLNIFIYLYFCCKLRKDTKLSFLDLLKIKERSALRTCIKAVASLPGFRYRLSVSDVWEEVPVRRLLTV